MGAAAANGVLSELPLIDLAYDHKNSENSAKELVYRIQPKWRDTPEDIQIVQFKEGITNTVRVASRGAHVPIVDLV